MAADSILGSNAYIELINSFERRFKFWKELDGSSILITGGTGMICSFLVDLILCHNRHGGNIRVVVTARNEDYARKRFAPYWDRDDFSFLRLDAAQPLELTGEIDYIIHGASNAHPAAIAKDSVGTMLANFDGMNHILQYAAENSVKRVMFISSGEVYGEYPSGSAAEDDYGYVDHMKFRACYPSSKRAAETLCSCYREQYGLDVVVARPGYVFGPTLNDSDTRVVCQFLRNAVKGEPIVMKSAGEKVRSYLDVADAVTGLLYVLVKGESGEAYNISDENYAISIRDMAETIAGIAGVPVRVDAPDVSEIRGASTNPRAVLDSRKLKQLGWNVQLERDAAFRQTIEMIKEISESTTPL